MTGESRIVGGEWLPVLTLKHPYAWMVIHGPKDLENRGWVDRILRDLIRLGLPFVVHASASISRTYYWRAVAFAADEDPSLVVPPVEELAATAGCLLGVVTPTAIVSPGAWRPPGDPDHRRWHMEGHHGWMLDARRPFVVPLPRSGRQRFWWVHRDVLPPVVEVGRIARAERLEVAS